MSKQFKLALFIIITIIRPLHAQIDTNLKYISKIIFKHDTSLNAPSVTLSNRTTAIYFNTDSIPTLAFYKADTIKFSLEWLGATIRIENLAHYLSKCNSSDEITIKLINKTTNNAELIQYDCTGEVYYSNFSSDEVPFSRPAHYIDVSSSVISESAMENCKVLSH